MISYEEAFKLILRDMESAEIIRNSVFAIGIAILIILLWQYFTRK